MLLLDSICEAAAGYIGLGRGQEGKLAAVFNFIDSSIRLLPQDKFNQASSMVNTGTEDQKILAWQEDVAKSTTGKTPTIVRDAPPTQSISPQVIVNQIVAPPVIVTRVRAAESKPYDEISTKAIIGTVLGATAGAWVAYAMVKGDSDNHPRPVTQDKIVYRTIDAPVKHDAGQTKSTIQIPILDAHSSHPSSADGKSGARTLAIGPPQPKAETLSPSAAYSRHSNRSDARSQREVSKTGPILMVDNDQDSRSRASSSKKTIRLADVAPSAPATEIRIARDVPLPAYSQASRYSRATSTTNKAKGAPTQSVESLLTSVVPNDSVSQASTRRSRDGGRSKHQYSTHHDGSKSGIKADREYESSRASKAEEKKASKLGDMVDDVVGIIKGPASKSGGHRSTHR